MEGQRPPAPMCKIKEFLDVGEQGGMWHLFSSVAGHPWACVIGPTASKEKLMFGWNGGLRFAKAMQLMDYSAQTTDEVVTKTSVSEDGLKAEQDPVVMKRPGGVLKRPASKVHMFAFLVVVFLVA